MASRAPDLTMILRIRLVMAVCALPVSLALLAGCSGNPTGASSGGIAVPDVVGTWSVAGTAPACVAGAISLVFAGTAEDVQPGGSLTFATTWSAAGESGALHGTVNLNNRSVILRLFGSPGSLRVASIEGVIKDTLGTRVLYAQLVDPYAGLSPLFGTTACTGAISGTRTGASQ